MSIETPEQLCARWGGLGRGGGIEADIRARDMQIADMLEPAIDKARTGYGFEDLEALLAALRGMP